MASSRSPFDFALTGFLLSKAGRTAAARFTERLEPLGLRPRHFALLNFVAGDEGCSQQALGERLGLDPSGLVAVIDDLEEQGLVERRACPGDRRRHAVHLTRPGRAKLRRAREAARSNQADLLAPLSEREIEVFHDLLLRVVAADDPQLRPVVGPRRART
jgi:MarR family transcriptional regulator, lower aerobic nicotinate degradation pathway regulator